MPTSLGGVAWFIFQDEETGAWRLELDNDNTGQQVKIVGIVFCPFCGITLYPIRQCRETLPARRALARRDGKTIKER